MQLMHVFGRINVEWYMISILAYRAILTLNFVEKAFPILASKNIYAWNHFDTIKAFKFVCKKVEFTSKTILAIQGLYFVCGRILLC